MNTFRLIRAASSETESRRTSERLQENSAFYVWHGKLVRIIVCVCVLVSCSNYRATATPTEQEEEEEK